MPGSRYNVAIFVQELPGPYAPSNALMFYRLWEGLNAMSEFDRYESTIVDVIYDRRICGKLYITPYRTSLDSSTNATMIGDVDGGSTAAIKPLDNSSNSSNTINSNNEESGVFKMRQHPAASVPYTFEGPRIAANDVSTAIIKGFIIIIVHDGALIAFHHLTRR
ncbi:MAG: hypothetical protein Q9225_006231 [Loekoesia sp. 1 TL-2023]